MFSLSANKAQEQKLQEMNGAQDVTVAELQQRIQSLEKELDNANELLSDSKLRGQHPRLLNSAFPTGFLQPSRSVLPHPCLFNGLMETHNSFQGYTSQGYTSCSIAS